MKTIITTVGTSLFTNCLKRGQDIQNHYENIKNKTSADYNKCRGRIDKIKPVIMNFLKNNNNDASAEIKSILKLKDELHDEIKIILLASDSIPSILAAEILSDYKFDNLCVNFDKDKDTINGLQVNNRKLFEEDGMPNLIKRIEDACDGYYENVVINITGGFKATIPYLTIMGQVNNIPLYYIFEETEELIKIPQSPIDISWGIFEKYADVFRELEKGIEKDWNQYKRQKNIEDDFKVCIWENEENNGMAELNAIGRIFWNKYKRIIMVYILKGMDYFHEKQGNKNQINKAIQELHGRLVKYIESNNIKTKTRDEILEIIRKLPSNNDLNHGGMIDRDKFIFKSTDIEQIRLVYSLDFYSGEIKSLKIYDYKRGGSSFNHQTYIQEFKDKFKSIGEPEFISIQLARR
ncbi:MAG: putative CRISPR-associated protein [Candidatus Brocadia sp.]